MLFEKLRILLDSTSFKDNVLYNIKKFHPNEKILEQGKKHSCVYLIKDGKVRIVVSGSSPVSAGSSKKEPVVKPGVNELGSDDIFGEFGIFDDAPASADVVAITETELIEIDIESFKNFLQKNPEIGYEILFEMLKVLVKRLRHANITIVNLFSWGIKAHHIDKYLE